MQIKTFLKFLLLILISNANAVAAPSQPADPEWDPIDLTFADIRFQLDREACGQGERNAMGCISAVNRWAAALQIDAEFVPERDSKKYQVLRRFKRLVMVKKKDKTAFDESSPNAYLQNIRKSKEIFLERYSNFAKAFHQKPESEFEDITMYLQELSEKTKPQRPGKRQIADIISEYLRIAFSPRDFLMSNITIEQNEKLSLEKEDFGFSGHEIDRGFLVQTVDEDSGAEDMGLQPWDVITEVNGVRLSQTPRGRRHLPLLEAKGDRLHLTVQRNNVGISPEFFWKTLSIQIPRTARVIKNFATVWREAFSQKWMQIKFSSFTVNDICQLMKNAIVEGEKEKAQGYVLDFRKNRGGAMLDLHCMAGIFIGAGKVVFSAQGSETKPEMSTGEQLTKKPVVILQDEVTASSAEVLASALRDHQRALLVGNLSFGKGSFQNCPQYPGKKHLRRCKMGAVVYSPAGRAFQGQGLTPDVQAYRLMDASEAEIFAVREKDKYLFPVVVGEAKNHISEDPEARPLVVPQECLWNRRQRAREENLVSGEILNDFQLLSGLSTLSCMWPSEGK